MISVIFRVLLIIVIVTLVLTALSGVAFTFNLTVVPFFSSLSSVFAIVCYLMPMNYLKPLFVIIISMQVFKIVIVVIKTIWDLLPIA